MQLFLEFDSGIVNILGANGVGKTSVLEAFTTFLAVKNLRNAKLDEIILHENSSMQIDLCIEKQNISHDLHLKYDKFNKKKQIFHNENLVKKNEQILEIFDLMCFSPQIYARFLHSTQCRRQFFDRIVYSFFPQHLQIMQNYNYLKQERQKVLYKESFDNDLIFTIEKKMSECALQIYQNREKSLQTLQENMQSSDLQLNIRGDFENELNNHIDIDEKIEIFQKILQKNRPIDKKLGRTTVGPHVSSFEIFFQQKSFDNCSSGEQKHSLLETLISQARAKISQNQSLILLFDDIVSQFDVQKMKNIIEQIVSLNVQCFITYVTKYPSLQGQIIQL